MAEVAGEIEAGNLKIAEVNIGIQVFGDNEKDLQANLNQIFELLQKNAIQLQIERGIFLGYYYAILPSGRKFNSIKVYMTTDNLATIFAPTKSATGFDKNPFGNMLISRFYTTIGESYSCDLRTNLVDC